ncbi:MAG: bacillithiol biosynthesis deacetylase BshB1 [Flavobacteriales bacterium]|jgi:bacillithiol biosynthesis deacetylase BshB1|nr:bacillithiol biosynthesis deacetylase BshB1 [Flavobacteriales bacterium]MBK6891686.1 bacillithiol biosynthesis deacetylase BshB1 [Flavobacteriales bacterium]MBK7247610.1 bacillithiol biosynthesis deacetylase BshB1 [Flavobacteriales bacterium]MBK7286552.1 bacillithiol biosynthesis deacetylase BshB1 [Flavobacteriales bacterium]MBK9060558.1 bacillithiol biosynthesis deacetylase BshB1 [Flavobacteriales bacterium]
MSIEKVDILCITAHPDDVEIGMGGTVARHIAQGRSVGLVELTAGELGTRGSAEIRRKEAEAAAQVLGVSFRYQLGLRDGLFRADEESLLKVVVALRRHRPKVVFTNAVRDRHPDHGRGSELVSEACFLSGLRRIVTKHEDKEQQAWRPVTVLHCVQDRWIEPDLVIDVSAHWEKKMEALKCFASQFHDPKSTEPVSLISVPEFLPTLEGRALDMGRLIGATYGEGFTVERPPGVGDVLELG